MTIHTGELTVAAAARLLPAGSDMPGSLWLEYAKNVLLEPEPALHELWLRRLHRRLDLAQRPRPWTILRVKPNMEGKVTDVLREAGLSVYHPRERYWPRRPGNPAADR
jgi:hypothetical protein